MKRICALGIITLTAIPAYTQRTLDLNECRRLALEHNKELAIAREAVDVARHTRKAAFTSYLPEITAKGGYLYNPTAIQLLSDEQKQRLSQLGTGLVSSFGANPTMTQAITAIAAKYPDLLPLIQSMGPQIGGSLAAGLNQAGASLVESLQPNTKHIYGGVLSLTQPLFVGGKIRAYNQITRYAEELAGSQYATAEQELILTTDQAYWQVVSLASKQRLALSYLDLLRKLESDIDKMIKEGIATKADGLNVAVKVNEAEMTLAKVEDGLGLARMLLCQTIGLSLSEQINLRDEHLEDLPLANTKPTIDIAEALSQRSELKSLRLAEEISKQKIRLTRAEYLPSLALVANYAITNPNLNNGLQTTLGARWNVGVMLKAPIWNWGQGMHKVRAAQAEARIAGHKLALASERIELQIAQSNNRVEEATKQLKLSIKNMEKAEENLRYANLGFREGLIPTSNVLEAQTAWLSAQSAKIDAQINLRLSELMLRKAIGTLKLD